ncbi:MAG: HAMP domain-containing histidine kinase [Nitrococcus mobilis]|nr:HAMP domain-containing histidine kinase [Nitrococcus mobilis]
MRLSTTLLVFVIAPLITLLALAAWLGLHRLEERVEAHKQEEIELIARAIRLPLSYALEFGQVGAIREALISAFEFDRVYGAHIFDQSGQLIASAGAGASANKLRQDRMADLNEATDRIGTFEQVRGEQLYSYFVPLTDAGGRITGILQVSRRGAEFQSALRQIRLWGFAALLSVGVMFAAIILVGHRWAIGGPIRRLASSMRRVESGARGHRTPVAGPGELRTLAEGFNSMLDSIERSERELAARRSRQQALEADLRHSQKLAAIGALATGIAHELGTPLSVVDGKAQRLLRRHGDTDVVREAAKAIRVEVERMAGTIRQLMDFARRNPISRAPEPADRLVELAVSALRDSSNDEGAGIEISGEGEPPVLHIDRNRMQRALLNLLKNAAQAASAGGLVRIGWLSSPDGPCLYVEDSGPGITDEIQARLFEPFFTTKSVSDGTGLGLAVVHGVVEDHGARIIVEPSPVLGGARFRIVFSNSDHERTANAEGKNPTHGNRRRPRPARAAKG